MRRLAAPYRRNGFVILRAVRSPPASPHPASRRRSCLRLRVIRLHIGWTFTSLTNAETRTYSSPRKRGSSVRCWASRKELYFLSMQRPTALDSRVRGNDNPPNLAPVGHHTRRRPAHTYFEFS